MNDKQSLERVFSSLRDRADASPALRDALARLDVVLKQEVSEASGDRLKLPYGSLAQQGSSWN